MAETLLKKEFRERDVNRLRNILTKKHGNATGIQVGYQKKEEDYKEGDVWEENGKMWTIKKGLKQTVTKLDDIKKAIRMPLVCPNCGHPMKNRLDKKMYPIHDMCFDCVVKMETKLKIEGRYEEYAKNMVTKNIITYIEEAEQFIDDFIKSGGPTYVTEQGDVEDWEGGMDKQKISNEMKKGLQELKEKLEK
jgi:hypothetical protein